MTRALHPAARCRWAALLFVAACSSLALVAEAQPAPDAPSTDAPPPDAPPADAPSTDAPPADAPPADAPPAEAPPPADADDMYGTPEDIGAESALEGPTVRYVLEDVEVRGNARTRAHVIESYVPFERGDILEPGSPELEAVTWRLRGTGWFSSVRLSLRRGSEVGRVVLVVEVEERNTFVVEQIAVGIAEGVNNVRDQNGELRPYVGVSVAETNLLGLGMRLSLDALMSRNQQGVLAQFIDPTFLDSRYQLRVSSLFNNAREYFGTEALSSIPCGPEAPDTCIDEVDRNNAVVFYRRGTVAIGTGRELNSSARYILDWQGEVVNTRSMPEAASEVRGGVVVPIDFHIEPELSFVSLVRFMLTYDRRDDPAMTTRGTLLNVQLDAGSRLIGSNYDFLRLQANAYRWAPLPWGHTLRIHGYAGVVFGDAPFYYLFHVSDLTDLIPPRALDMEIDRRAAPNFFNTSIEVMRKEDVALRVDIQYELPLYRSRTRGLRALNAYFNVGVYSLASIEDLRVAIPGYDGFSKLPVDLTFDVGFRFDTVVGVFQFGFSNILGFIAL